MKTIEGNYVYETETTEDGASITKLIGMTKRTELAFTGTHITATVLNYEGIVQFGYNDPVTFEVEGSTFTTNAINGVATMEFDVDPGTYTVRTVNADLANGELIVNA